MKLTSSSFENDTRVPARNAMGVPDDAAPATFGPNVSPHLAWSEVPEGTKSFALLCYDPDVPSVGDDVNQAGRTVSKALPRVDFFHWVLVDIPADRQALAEGADADGVTPKGKALGATPNGVRGLNSYTDWFAGNPDMAGDYGGYDGPFPPWNDELLHHYRFTLYALDVERLNLSGRFGGPEVRAAIAGHILAEAVLVGTYSLNPDVG